MNRIFLVLFMALSWLPYSSLVSIADDSNATQPSTLVAPTLDFDVSGTAGRIIPIRVYLPESQKMAPVIIFSHGLGGSRENNVFLSRYWAEHGYVVVCMQHQGSDTSVWQNVPQGKRLDAMKKAANYENFMLRVKDATAVLNALETWNATAGHPLASRLDLTRIGISGHSFGAATAQALCGQKFMKGKLSLSDPRFKAAVILSPNCPRRGGTPEQNFGEVAAPWMLITGTDDTSIITDAKAEERRKVFPALPPGGKYELVLKGAEHSAFADKPLRGDRLPRNPNHHRAIMALTTAFFDAYLRNDENAKKWLSSDGPKKLLESGDQWQIK